MDWPGGIGEDDIHERVDGDASAVSGADLVGYPAVELPSELSPGEEVDSEELRRSEEDSLLDLAHDSYSRGDRQHAFAFAANVGERLSATV